MLTVDQFALIRQLRRDGLTIRQIADQLHHSPKTILKALENPEPVSARASAPRPAPVFGPFRPFVDAILAADAPLPCERCGAAPEAVVVIVEVVVESPAAG